MSSKPANTSIDQEIAQLLRKRQQLIEGAAGDGVYAKASDEERRTLYKALSTMIDALAGQAA